MRVGFLNIRKSKFEPLQETGSFADTSRPSSRQSEGETGRLAELENGFANIDPGQDEGVRQMQDAIRMSPPLAPSFFEGANKQTKILLSRENLSFLHLRVLQNFQNNFCEP